MFVAHQKFWVDLSLIEEHFTGVSVKVLELDLDWYRISIDDPVFHQDSLPLLRPISCSLLKMWPFNRDRGKNLFRPSQFSTHHLKYELGM